MINAIFFGIIIKVPNNPFFLIFFHTTQKGTPIWDAHFACTRKISLL